MEEIPLMIFQNKIKHAFIRNSIWIYTLGVIKPRIKLKHGGGNSSTVWFRSGLGGYSVSGSDQECCGCSEDNMWSVMPGWPSHAFLWYFPEACYACCMYLVLALAREWGHCHCVRLGGAVTSIWVLCLLTWVYKGCGLIKKTTIYVPQYALKIILGNNPVNVIVSCTWKKITTNTFVHTSK